MPVIKRHKQEKTFLDPNTLGTFEFPSIEDEASVELSVIVPAYNEEDRSKCFIQLHKMQRMHFSQIFQPCVLLLFISESSKHSYLLALKLILSIQVPSMLEECLEFLENKTKRDKFSYEVIVVSDGSSDGTVSLALEYSKKYSVNKVRVLELVENRGKGGAVRLVSNC